MTGISGFDRMSGGGLPLARISAVIGGAGAGKTVFAMQSMISVVNAGGNGVFVSFEQSPHSIREGFMAFDWNAEDLFGSDRICILDGRMRSDVAISGGFDIAGLLASVGGAFPPGQASCIVFDGIDALLSLLESTALQRTELLRMQEYVEQLSSTVILTLKSYPNVTGGFEEVALYMSDCVVELERNTEDGLANRSLRIQKYRSSAHAQSRVPFLMTQKGIEIAAIEAEPKQPPITSERLSVGIARLDEMLAGGVYRGSSTLLSGSPGTAKTTLGASFLEACCNREERALAIFFDENPGEIVRNAASVRIDLERHVGSGLLRLHGMVDRSAGPDEFAHEIAEQVRDHHPRHLLIDPISIFTSSQSAQNAVRRLLQLCKREGITVVMTSLLDRLNGENESSRSNVSTLCDNWIHLSYLVQSGERNRSLTVVKSRGTPHSNQVGELLLSNEGITIADAFTEDGAVLMGSLRWQKERANEQDLRKAELEADRVERGTIRDIEELERRQLALETELKEKREDLHRLQRQARDVSHAEEERRDMMSRRRSSRSTLSAPQPDGDA
ncbi:circadian clock protein KaiC [Ancylobacter sp. 3268]|uniref:circadian clock protein KaiC n=1 Tax=Ancylobacter sp. 3268 TaxID=2817752 RepID=UPI002856EA07|nr:circadian clock protein KaiC [Ancylobacter sp. 3268]MDR6951130.1 circadian clock protein KaiC [Ancylobacter sp. 3268]